MITAAITVSSVDGDDRRSVPGAALQLHTQQLHLTGVAPDAGMLKGETRRAGGAGEAQQRVLRGSYRCVNAHGGEKHNDRTEEIASYTNKTK